MSETAAYLWLCGFVVLSNALVWGMWYFFKRDYGRLTRELVEVSQSPGLEAMAVALDACIRSFHFARLVRGERIPPPSDVSAFRDFYHGGFMEKARGLPVRIDLGPTAHIVIGAAYIFGSLFFAGWAIIDFDPAILLLLAIPIGWGSGTLCCLRSRYRFNEECLRLFTKIDHELEKLPAEDARP